MTDSTTDPKVRVATGEGVARITLDSPANRNALSDQLVDELHAALTAAEADESVRVVLLTHTGGTFCAGADLSAATSGRDSDPAATRAHQLIGVLEAILRLAKPVIGRVDGHVRAGGVGLVAACDLVVAGPRSTFALTESRIGLAPAVISVAVLPRLTDRAASELLLTGDTIDVGRAERIGLVSKAVEDSEDLDEVVDGWLESLRKCSPQGLRETKAVLTHHLLAALEADRDRVVAQSARLFGSEEAREGMLAFLERRPPRWAV